jgi:hypothetical protein
MDRCGPIERYVYSTQPRKPAVSEYVPRIWIIAEQMLTNNEKKGNPVPCKTQSTKREEKKRLGQFTDKELLVSDMVGGGEIEECEVRSVVGEDGAR